MNFNDLYKQLSGCASERIVFVALGNDLRGDDGAAYRFVDKLKSRSKFASIQVIRAGTTPENHLHQICRDSPQAVVFIDAADFGQKPGTIEMLPDDRLKTSASTHTYSLAMIAQYLQFECPAAAVYYLGIQPHSLACGTLISAEVNAGLDRFFAGSI
ncbi:hydrogenase maturation protease [candidate division KSB1 bacterium]|nr:hydrogenase maturation protease [candidate division KSB1 bacterium]